MADTTSGNISFAGLGSGTDFGAMIDGFVKLERTQITSLEKWKKSWSSKVDQFHELNTSLLALQTTLKSMDTIDEFMSKVATSSNEDAVTATATSEATVTSHNLFVRKLAQNDIRSSDGGVASIKDSIFSSNGSFSFTYQGDAIVLSNIPAGTTMEGFINLINNHVDTKDRIRATTISDGTTLHLQLSGLDLGQASMIIVDSLVGLDPALGDLTRTQLAQDAEINVDGFPPGDFMRRASNTIDDAIIGLTFTLKDTSVANASNIFTTPFKLGVTTDTEKIKENVQKFVDQINEVRQKIKDMTAVDTTSEKPKGSILTGNYGVELLIGQRLKSITASKGEGFTWFEDLAGGGTKGDKYSSLSQVGILTNADTGGANAGLLELDMDELSKALLDDPYAVAEIFAAHEKGTSNSPNVQYMSHIEGSTEPGSYNVQYEVSGGVLVSATINGHAAAVIAGTWEITGVGGTPEAGLGMKVLNHTDGVYGNSNDNASDAILVSVKEGKAGEMVGAISDILSKTGPLNILEENYNDIMDNIDKKIEREENRIDLFEQNLKLKYSRLDALLGKYQGIQAQLTSSIKQLGSGSS
ncbi:flagellar filament capping protein FliD [Desulfovibrio gilichinskyi]|uniref:Flagellar hook-associated protein 2 n=1 Tax=Desulfovibrio gilichinskyi TaxID=1519643 RepID=A0A1X7D4X7_9BACT|nr:flagellar filament capping protein FliD [Desulfovibrio gilichinskyi]SMF08990.1 flagellar hook-associated protein 2 [Desulfovibrio gilichinskyi]